ncbi:hypothetical protein EYF80_067341 [Liparis tanakae]|uniref:Uncharacterized protein n=1 Tax=Liparis tanakae TaxID=230148 RepID=A0A4Z2E188_9TELE|nr:hypothetical protein EYF80_067341 [Liparis tanakae]
MPRPAAKVRSLWEPADSGRQEAESWLPAPRGDALDLWRCTPRRTNGTQSGSLGDALQADEPSNGSSR